MFVRRVLKYVLQNKLAYISKYFLSSAGFSFKLHNANIASGFKGRTINRQQRAWEKLIKSSSIENRFDVKNLRKIIAESLTINDSVLEVGCASGYNKTIFFQDFPKYFGLDISHDALLLGTRKNPNVPFITSSSSQIPLRNSSIDMVLDGASLIHIKDWKQSIKEYFRISKKFIVLHSITLSSVSSFELTKFAYGQKVVEHIFLESELSSYIDSFKYKDIVKKRNNGYNLIDLVGIETNSYTWVIRL